jgi:hypothetical protein
MPETYSVAQLCAGEALLRRLAGEVLKPGPWKHDLSEKRSGDYDNQLEDRICVRCGASEFLHQTDGPCTVPDSPADPLPVIAERLVKRIESDKLECYMEDATRALRVTIPTEKGKWLWIWYVMYATPTDQIICCLLALLPDRVKIEERT